VGKSGVRWRIMYYSGIYYHSLDKKNRFFLPSKLRKSKARFVFTTPVVDKCIYLYPDDEWKKILLKFDNLQLKDKSQERAFKRIFLSSAEDAQVDPQGRLLIPKKLISEAKIDKKDSPADKKIVIVGIGNRLEIWSEKHWKQYLLKAKKISYKVAQELEI